MLACAELLISTLLDGDDNTNTDLLAEADAASLGVCSIVLIGSVDGVGVLLTLVDCVLDGVRLFDPVALGDADRLGLNDADSDTSIDAVDVLDCVGILDCDAVPVFDRLADSLGVSDGVLEAVLLDVRELLDDALIV